MVDELATRLAYDWSRAPSATTVAVQAATVAAARALTVPAAQTILALASRTTAGDGLGGLFEWDPSSTATDDNGATTIAITGVTTGRWRRMTVGVGAISLTASAVLSGARQIAQLQGGTTAEQYVRDAVNSLIAAVDRTPIVANVKSYGAVGNGVADDRAAIQSALDTRLPVYFPAGVYRIGATLRYYNDQMIYGDSRSRNGGGKGAQVVAAGNFFAFTPNNYPARTSYVVFANLSIDNATVANAIGISGAAGHNAATGGIDLGGVAHAIVHRCSFRYHYKAIRLLDTGTAAGAYTTANLTSGSTVVSVDSTTYMQVGDSVNISHPSLTQQAEATINAVGANSITISVGPPGYTLPSGSLVTVSAARYMSGGYYCYLGDVEIGSCTYGVHGAIANATHIGEGGRIHSCQTGVYLERSGGFTIRANIERCGTGVRFAGGTLGCVVEGYLEGNGKDESSYWPNLSYASRQLGGMICDEYTVDNVGRYRASGSGDFFRDYDGRNRDELRPEVSAPCGFRERSVGENLLPQIELDADGNGTPDLWSVTTGNQYTHGLDSSVMTTRGMLYGGVASANALRLSIVGSSTSRRQVFTTIGGLTVGQFYTLSMWIRVDSGGVGKFRVHAGPTTALVTTAGAANLSYFYSGVVGATGARPLYADEWHRARTTFVATAATFSIMVEGVQDTQIGAGSIWIADLQLTRGRMDAVYSPVAEMRTGEGVQNVAAASSISITQRCVRVTGASTTINTILPPVGFGGPIFLWCDSSQTFAAGTARGAPYGGALTLTAQRLYTLMFDTSVERWIRP